MAEINRLQVTWAGQTALPGLSTFYFLPLSTSAPADVVAFFTAIRGLFASGLTWTIPGSGDVIESTTGVMVDTWETGGGGPVNSNNVGANYAAGVGARVQWNTATVAAGRRVRGATYLTNLATGNFDAQGTIQDDAANTIRGAADTLVDTQSLVIWSRPRPSLPNGAVATINGYNVPDRITALRSRRY